MAVDSEKYIDIVGYNDEREPDTQYVDLLRNIMENGQKVGTQLEDSAWTLFAPGHLKYDLKNGFPISTERDLTIPSKSAFAEITAFINGVRTLEELEEWGCGFWKNFINDRKTDKRGLDSGDFGPGSYGAAYHDFPSHEAGQSFNQIQAMTDQIKANPQLRTHVATTIVPSTIIRAPGYDQKVVWTPCHGSLVHVRILEDELHMHHVQRSADAPVGLPFNMLQYAGLQLVLAKETGYTPGTYTHTFSDVHIYDRQKEDVEELLSREQKPYPKALVREGLRDVFDWRAGDIVFEDYEAGPRMTIDTPND